MSKIENPKTELMENINMNDEDRLNVILNIEKNMGVNLTIALNESSNEFLYGRLFNLFETIKDLQRDLYEIMFQYGWYSLEEVETTKLNEQINKLRTKLTKIENQE